MNQRLSLSFKEGRLLTDSVVPIAQHLGSRGATEGWQHVLGHVPLKLTLDSVQVSLPISKRGNRWRHRAKRVTQGLTALVYVVPVAL